MSTTAISIDLTPISALAALVKALAEMTTSIGNVSSEYRASMSPANRDRLDTIWVDSLARVDGWSRRIDKWLQQAIPEE